jgi:tRNA (cmo5U34)-methyltransferase
MSQATGWENDDTTVFVTYADAFVPRRAEQFAVIGALARAAPGHRVLELGCGDGRLTEALLRALPGTHLTAIDAAPEMLGLARGRLAPFAGRAELRRSRIEDAGNWAPGGYGAVVTSLAMHHLDDPAKQAAYRDIATALCPGGAFVLADMFRPTGDPALALAAEQWDAEVRHAGQAASDAFTQAQWNTFRFPDPVDMPATIRDHLHWLEQTGFTEIDVAWAYAGHAVLHARRSELQKGH